MRHLKLALRMLLRTPIVTTVAILSLGLGIGANTAVFSLFNQLLLRPLPVASPGELVNLGAPGPKSGDQSCNQAGDCDSVFSYPMFRDLERAQTVFTGIAAHRWFNANIGYEGQTIAEDGLEVSGAYFGLLGLQPARGRLIVADDDRTPGESRVAVLSHEYWRRRFNSDPAIVGQSIIVNSQTLQVVGVAPAGFDGTTKGSKAKVFVPITLRGLVEPPFADFNKRTSYWVYLFARLKPGVTIEEAKVGLNVPYRAILTDVELPLQTGMKDDAAARFREKQVTLEDGRRGQSSVYRQASTPMLVLLSVTTVVLLIACANIANLLLARGAARAGEMAVRLSIGASRAQLVRQLLIEACLLAAMGGLAGLLFMQWTIAFVQALLPAQAVGSIAAEFTLPTLAFGAALSMITGLLFGLFPALHSTRPDLASTLKGQAGQPSGARAASRFRTVLVTFQIALSMGLLTCAGLFTKSLVNVGRVDLGVTVDHLVTFRLGPQRNGYSFERSRALFAEVEEALAGVPGVTSVSAARVPLIANSSSSTGIEVEGYEPPPGGRTGTNYNEISPNYFRTVGIPLLAGRDFTAADTIGAPKVAIVNEAFARRYNLGANPIGRRIARGSKTFDIEIVGLVQDAKYSQVRAETPAVFFMPYRQNQRVGTLAFYARTASDPDSVVRAIGPLVARIDPNLPVATLRTMEEQVSDNVALDRLNSVLSVTFAGLATLLAALGLYGVLAYTVSQRTREFGLRMALGAAPSGVRLLVLRQVMWMTLAGGAIGLAAAIYVGRLAAALLFDMQSYDPLVLAGSTVMLTLVALMAGFVPARRASEIDPMRALRYE